MNNYRDLFDILKNYEKIVITSHENPDADAIGSEYAMCKMLSASGYNASIITCEEIPEKYKFIDIGNLINVYSKESVINLPDREKTILLILDTNNPYNTGYIYTKIKDKINEIFIIDHHETEKTIIDLNRNIINVSASSTCEIVYDIAKAIKYEMDIPFCQAIYSGIIYDTGMFAYPKTDYKTLEIASRIVKKGVKPNFVYSNIFETNTLSSLKLQAKVFSEIKFFLDNKIALQIMKKSDLEEFNAKYEDGDTIINLPMKCKDILVSVFFKENYEGILRCSIRSKNNIDISGIAAKFGGGGHTTAAGFKCIESLEIVAEKVLKELYIILGKK
jgi:phosphoesterase RecJ-like protein